MALTAHRRTLFLRREAAQLTAVVDRLKEIVGKDGSWRSSGSGGTMAYEGRAIQLAGCEHEDDKLKYQGHPDDLKAFDELAHFTRSQYRFIIGWNRTVDPNQRCRVIAAGNPPTSPESRWVVEEWGPWLDPEHPDPAVPGELRWYTVIDEKLVWFKTADPVIHKGEVICPKSRTFIPAFVQDNPDLVNTGYIATLQALPEPLRSQMLYGDFNAGVEEDAWQVIPSKWVRIAQARWTPHPPPGQALSCVGVDVARGGADSTVPAPRYGPWFAPLTKYQGEITDDGPKAAALVLREYHPGAPIHVDATGLGSACYDALKANPLVGNHAVAVNVAASPVPPVFDKTGRFRLRNIRAAMYWQLREALDPESGQELALPPSPELLSDLCASRFQITASGIIVEPKEQIIQRIGRSPDLADAVCLAHWQGGGITAQMHVLDLEAMEKQLVAERELSHSVPTKPEPVDASGLTAYQRSRLPGYVPTPADEDRQKALEEVMNKDPFEQFLNGEDVARDWWS